jgi:glyceraldehyde-3-phosphate dehydrogenase (NADP+)
MRMRTDMLVAGRWTAGGKTTPVIDRDDGLVIAEVSMADASLVEQALLHAKDGAPGMRAVPPRQRARVLATAARRLESESEGFAKLISQEGVKTVREARKEVARCAATLMASASVAEELESGAISLPPRDGRQGLGIWTTRSAGVIAAITPFNDPLNLAAHKIGPAIATGSPVILKPDERTPLSALALAEALLESGLPSEALQVLHGPGRTVGAMLVASQHVRVVSFTGGGGAGREISKLAGLKVLQMELGGICPTIVAEDADANAAMEKIVSGALWAAGQNCLHVQRLLVHRRHFAQVLDGVVSGFGSATLGTKRSDATQVGPLIDEVAVRKVEALVRQSLDRGASLYCGGARTHNGYVPTLMSVGKDGLGLIPEEVFGPVTQIEVFDSLDQAIASARRTGPSLQAGLFTDSRQAMERVRDGLDVGALIINDTSDFRVDTMPFGGPGTSGIGREGVSFTAKAYTEPLLVCYPW